jgi:hypothetical protein
VIEHHAASVRSHELVVDLPEQELFAKKNFENRVEIARYVLAQKR